MESIDPATGAVVGSFERDDTESVDATFTSAAEAFGEWKRRPLRERKARIAAVADVLRANEREYADLVTAEMGKPIGQARAAP